MLVGASASQAQFSAPGGLPPGFHHALFDVLNGGVPFSGQANIQMVGATGQDASTISCSVAYLAGKMRVEVDSFDPGTNVPPAEAARLKSMRSVMLIRPDVNRMYLLYPDLRSYVEVTYCKSTGTDPAPTPVINRNILGKESIAGQSCEKSQWNITESDGEHYDLTVWAATNSGSFPAQIRLGPPAALVTFQSLNLGAPDANIFEPPSGYVKFSGIQENILRVTEKSQNGSSPTNAP